MQLTMNRILSLILLVISIVYIYLSFQLPSYAPAVIDSDAIPKVLGFILLGLSFLLFFDKKDTKMVVDISKKDVFYLVLTVVMIIIYILLLESVGFLLMTSSFLFIATLIYGYRNHLVNLIVSLSFTFIMYYLFNELLMVRLPQGILSL